MYSASSLRVANVLVTMLVLYPATQFFSHLTLLTGGCPFNFSIPWCRLCCCYRCWWVARGGCARIMKRHESSTLEGSRCHLIPVLSGLQECNCMTLQYKQVMTRVQPPLMGSFIAGTEEDKDIPVVTVLFNSPISCSLWLQRIYCIPYDVTGH